MMKERVLASTIFKAIQTFPGVVITGPRQSGKTTLLKMLFSDTHKFVTLEDPDIRIRAKEDPRAFLDQYSPPVILDEIQYVPDLLPYIKTRIDEDRKPGQWLFTGSQNFVLMQGISESLAGRAAILSLLPFSFSEITGTAADTKRIDGFLQAMPFEAGAYTTKDILSDLIFRGCYPEIATIRKVDRNLWCSSYISTYLERDVRNITNIGDLSQFERFLKCCAIRTGQILNISEIARDIGISVPTARKWLSILETGYQVFLLYPYYKNIGKRLVKSPKLYFTDTGLASYLLGISNTEVLLNSPNFPNLFETFVVADFLKRFLNRGDMPSMYYVRSRDGLEVDLVIESGQKLHLFEIKSSMTITPKHATSLVRLMRELGNTVKTAGIISRARENMVIKDRVFNYNWKSLLKE